MNTAERFWSKVKMGAGCWEWQASKYGNGYGVFRNGKKHMKAHRMAWELTHGPIPDGLQVNHHCDNRTCCNPAHLYVGTQKQNRQDAVRRNRTAKGCLNGMNTHPEARPRGARNGNSRLTDEQYASLRHEYASGSTLTDLGRKYGISKQSVASLVGRRKQHQALKGV